MNGSFLPLQSQQNCLVNLKQQQQENVQFILNNQQLQLNNSISSIDSSPLVQNENSQSDLCNLSDILADLNENQID